ncbi:hypothetical protein ACIGXM_14215 [Kitasatospora sp. NPDC052896]|uniref:hypothetical protein n=1 Tax=Kitasatospora sp. NPDC052896 TaxID=3364061 RepID=UPI0037C62F0A
MKRRNFEDPDAGLDQTAIAHSLMGRPAGDQDSPSADADDNARTPRRLSAYQVRQRLTKGRTPRPDSATGLANDFLGQCPTYSWTGGLELSNFTSIVGIFSELLRVGVTPDVCRAMTRLYFQRLDGRTPNKAYCWDFKWQRHELLRSLTDTGATTTPADYADWSSQPQASQSEREAFAASWGLPPTPES